MSNSYMVYKIMDAEGPDQHIRTFESEVASLWAKRGFEVKCRMWYHYRGNKGRYEKRGWRVW